MTAANKTRKKRTTTKPTKTKPRKKTVHRTSDASGGNDRKSARKFRRGGRIEAYTFGEALSSRDWP